MQPTGRDLYIERLLSQVSIGYMNAVTSYIADRVFPVVPVDVQSGKYAKYRKSDWFRDEAQIRAPLTESVGGGFELETPGTYFCDEWSYHKDIADEDMANKDEIFELEDDATEFVVDKLRMRRERLWSSTYFKTGVWGKDLSGQTDTPGTDEFKCWDVSGSTPIEDIADAATIVKMKTGINPNTLVVSERVHKALKNHSDILDRYKYTQAGIITSELIAKVLEIDRYMIAEAVYDSIQEGGTSSLSYILDQYGAMLVYSAPRPSRRRPSGGYTLRWKRPVIGGREGERLESTIRRFRLDREGGIRIEGSIYEDVKLVAADVGVFFKDAIAAGRTIES